ncbi:hypothetical protein [Enterococcus sp. 2201sp1_2201st1_B8_2201SCRN_220225]|uniref:hypothetical protein n=1 Tax=unclassified Enterococcus TaxID=2608891 RepID=UPI0034A49AFE
MIAIFLIFFGLGLWAYLSGGKSESIRYKGLAQKALGKQVVPFVHRILGILLMVTAAIGGIYYQFFNSFSQQTFFWGYLLITLLCFLISDLVAVARFKNN